MTAYQRPILLVHRDRELLIAASGARLLLALSEAQSRSGTAHLVLTGGSMGSAVLAGAGASGLLGLVDWSRLHLWWGDERYLPAGHPDRNDTQNRAALLDTLPLDPTHVHAVAGPELSTSVHDSAQQYAGQLAAAAAPGQSLPDFDILLLGVGPDAHVASLFPGHPSLSVTDRAVMGISDSPKPPSERVTMTFPTLARATQTWFLVSGADKADAVKRSLAGAPTNQAPAGTPHGRQRTLWLVDAAAAGQVAAPA